MMEEEVDTVDTRFLFMPATPMSRVYTAGWIFSVFFAFFRDDIVMDSLVIVYFITYLHICQHPTSDSFFVFRFVSMMRHNRHGFSH